MKPNAWTAVMVLLLLSPFFLLAQNLKDWDEVIKSGVGLMLGASALGIKKLTGN